MDVGPCVSGWDNAEVLRPVAPGLDNQETAEKLVISERRCVPA